MSKLRSRGVMYSASAIIFIVGVAIGIAGCASQADLKDTSDEYQIQEQNKDESWAFVQELPDGRSVVCISTVAGLSCDWEHAGSADFDE